MPPYGTISSKIVSTKQFNVVQEDEIVGYAELPKVQKPQDSKISRFLEFISKLKWLNLILLTTLHVVWVIDTLTFPWLEKKGSVFYQYALGMLAAIGLVAGVHRLWTHRSYKAKLPLRIMLMLFYSMTGQNPIFNWVRDHRVHHKYTDTDADPHNSNRGFFFSHVGWLMMKKHPEVIRKGKEIDMSDILSDPVVQFHQRYYYPLVFGLTFFIPTLIPPLLWGESWYWSILHSFVDRYCFVLNLTWIINSSAHTFGNRPFDKSISPTDNYKLAHFTLGEAWHNFHHTFPWSYRYGQYGGYVADWASCMIDGFAKLGLAYDLKTPSPELIQKAAKRYGDGTFPGWKHLEIPEDAEREILKSIN